MEKSASIANIAKALDVFHTHISNIPKDATNPFFNPRYCSLPNILKAIKEPLHKSGLSFTQFPTGANGLVTMLMHGESGEYMQSDYFMNPTKSDPQAQGSVISYMRRYALAAVLGLNLDGDDDGNAATHGVIETHVGTGNNVTTTMPEKPWLNQDSKVYEKIVVRLQNKTASLEQIAQHFRLSKQVRASLQTIINGVAYQDN